ncbi:MAG: ornithine cyclodeaminase, nickel-pincer nucleotide-dependent [Chloroflexota bacterium]
MNDQQLYTQVIELEGHIIDSMILPQIMDSVIDRGGDFDVQEIRVGRRKTETSYARIEIRAKSPELLDLLVQHARRLGAIVPAVEQVLTEPAPTDGVFPEGFYSTTNLETMVRLNGGWIPVANPEMDLGIVVDWEAGTARNCPMSDVKKGDHVVVGHQGIRVIPLERSREEKEVFSFMGSAVSSEKPKAILIREIAAQMRAIKARGGKTLVVAGPAVAHTGSAPLMAKLIEAGYVDYLFAGNALATHDIEAAFFGTSLGISLSEGVPMEGGHQHHVRAINRIRHAGSIKAAVEQGMLTKGVMYSCVKRGVQFVLAGSIRDDGPLPDVITDVIDAQRKMREVIQQGVDLALMISTMLHSIAVGNLLPANVTTVCVDINPAVATKLADRGSFQAIGLVADTEGFLRHLVTELGL